MSNTVSEIVGALIVVVSVVITLSLLFSIVTMLLWNWLMPVIFSLPKITWLQAFGLTILLHLLIGGANVSKKSN